jgi:aspartate aminotransferase
MGGRGRLGQKVSDSYVNSVSAALLSRRNLLRFQCARVNAIGKGTVIQSKDESRCKEGNNILSGASAIHLSQRTCQVSGSQTSGMRNKAHMLRAGGLDIVNFAAGELDLPPHPQLRAALRSAANDDVHRYTETEGLPELREALAQRIFRLSGVQYMPNEVLVTVGAKHAIYLTCLALLDPGDEVLIPSPSWGTFSAQVLLAGGNPIPVDTQDTGFVPTVERLESLRTVKTCMIILNTPNNPTGIVYTHDLLTSITEWAVRNRLWIVFDECYGELVLEGVQHVHPASVVRDARNLMIGIGSFSKSFAVTGWRTGHAHGPERVIRAMKNLQSHTTSNATSVVQHALLPAARGELDSFVQDVRDVLRRRHLVVQQALARIPYLSAPTPQGAFYFFLDARKLVGRKLRGTPVTDSAILAELLLEQAHIALTPGSAFGSEGFLRLSYAIADDRIRQGFSMLQDVMNDVE